jgi:hypothetical protein
MSQGREIVAFANAAIDEQSWRQIIHAASVERLAPVPPPTSDAVCGVNSCGEAVAIQGEFRRVLALVLVATGVGGFLKRHEIGQLVTTRAKLRISYDGAADDDRLVARWATEHDTFEEFLYTKLAASLVNDGFTAYARCPACERFIFRRTAHRQQYCDRRCRALASFRRRRQISGASQTLSRSKKPIE